MASMQQTDAETAAKKRGKEQKNTKAIGKAIFALFGRPFTRQK